MPRLITIICLLLLLFSPIFAFASGSPTTETSSSNLIPIYFFGDQNGDILTVVSTSEDHFIWAYFNPHAVTTAGSIALAYDDNGNLTGDGTYTYAWDYNNRLSLSIYGDTAYSYYYDHDGNRVKKVQGGNTTIYVNQYYEIDPSGKITKHIYGGGDRIALIETVSGTTTPYYVHKDHLGGSSVITDSSGNKAELVDYYPYGTTRLDEKVGSFESRYKFTGKELDSETGLYYYGQRYYNPSIGRFVSEDPVFLRLTSGKENKTISQSANIEKWLKDFYQDNKSQKNKEQADRLLIRPQILNSYSYALNNPLRYIDPNGELPWQQIFNFTAGRGWKSDAQVSQKQGAQIQQSSVKIGNQSLPRTEMYMPGNVPSTTINQGYSVGPSQAARYSVAGKVDRATEVLDGYSQAQHIAGFASTVTNSLAAVPYVGPTVMGSAIIIERGIEASFGFADVASLFLASIAKDLRK